MSSDETTVAAERKKLGWTVARLAQAAGLSAGTIYDIESRRNTNPSHFIVTRLVTAFRGAGLDVTAESLFPVPVFHGLNGTGPDDRVQRESVGEGSAK